MLKKYLSLNFKWVRWIIFGYEGSGRSLIKKRRYHVYRLFGIEISIYLKFTKPDVIRIINLTWIIDQLIFNHKFIILEQVLLYLPIDFFYIEYFKWSATAA